MKKYAVSFSSTAECQLYEWKVTNGICVPVYQTQCCDSKNLRGDFKTVGRDMTKAINEAKVRWYGKKS